MATPQVDFLSDGRSGQLLGRLDGLSCMVLRRVVDHAYESGSKGKRCRIHEVGGPAIHGGGEHQDADRPTAGALPVSMTSSETSEHHAFRTYFFPTPFSRTNCLSEETFPLLKIISGPSPWKSPVSANQG